jgi:hypothetical protein
MTKAELYRKLTSATDLHKALVEHFSFLADSEGFMPVLEAVMGKVESVTFKEDNGYGKAVMYLHFPGDDEPQLIYGEVNKDDYSMYPPSYQKIRATCSYIIFPANGGWALQFGDDDFNTKETGELILSPLSDFSEIWVYHPTEKNPQGEPLLCLVIDETCQIDEAVSCNIGSLYLKRVAEYLDLGNIVPNVKTECPKPTFTLNLG